MKLLTILFLCLSIINCGSMPPTIQGPPGQGCTEKPVTATGKSGDPFQYGGILVTCPNGYSTLSNGAPGSIGPTGEAGSPGLDATPLTVIQLCTGYTTTYPSSFPEQAFCINNSLYAVYWNGSQAFLALVVPGQYSSTSPQGCTFTVGPNCVVTP